MFRSFVATAVLALVLTAATQAQISIVVGTGSPHTAAAGDLAKIFGAAKFTWENGRKIVVAEPGSAAVAKAFYESFLGKTVSQVRNDWTKIVLSGEGTGPKKCADLAAFKKALADDPDAIGFIPTASIDPSVKEVYRIMAFIKAE